VHFRLPGAFSSSHYKSFESSSLFVSLNRPFRALQVYPKDSLAFTFLVKESSKRSQNTSQSSKAPTKIFGVAFGSVSISGPCVDRFDVIFAVRIFGSPWSSVPRGNLRSLPDRADTIYGPNFWIVLITGHPRQSTPSLLESSPKISKRTRPGSPEPADQTPPPNPLATVQRNSRSQRTKTTREIAFAAGRSAARDEFHEQVTSLEAQVQALQAELASAQSELHSTQETLAATRAQPELAVAQLLRQAPRPPVAPASAYLPRVPRKQP